MLCRWAKAFLICVAVQPLVLAQSNPPKLPGVARFDLNAQPSVGAITNGMLLAGDGSVARQNWLSAAEQPRTCTINASIVHYAWRELEFEFTPASSGTVTLTLRGPWEESPGGSIYRQEVLWDAVSSVGATLNNGSFENVGPNGVPPGWVRPYGDAVVEDGPVTPQDGQRYARIWHDGPLTYSLAVTAGQSVTLRFHARAQTVPGFVDMEPVTDTNSPAHLMARRLMRGVNLGNYLEAPPGQDWGATYAARDFDIIRAEGFDHVRLPIGWHHYAGPAPSYTLSAEILGKADFLVTNAVARGLGVIVNIHHFDEFTSAPLASTNRFYAIWRQIATHYAAFPGQVVFELLNEPKDAATTTVLNPIYAEAVRQIRSIDPNRTILVGPGQWNSIGELTALRLPDDDANLIVTVHLYEPFLFTHQGANWTGSDTATVGIVFPGPPSVPLNPAAGVSTWVTNWIQDYNGTPAPHNPSSAAAFRGRLELAREWSTHYGRPVHIGEFGCYSMADPVSRARFYREFREVADELGLGWAMWDWKAGFRYWDESNQQPAPGLREAMFPPPVLGWTENRMLELNGAVGKTYVIERSPVVGTAGLWTGIHTQWLETPLLRFSDASMADAAYYRAVWVKE